MLKIKNNLILFASSNKGKLQEVQTVAKSFGLTVVSPAMLETSVALQYGFTAPLQKLPPVPETASSYSENAKIKAEAYYAWSGLPALADDSGLEVDSLGGRPGVYSARYAGPKAGDKENISKLLDVMSGQANRKARFVSFLYFKLSTDKSATAKGELAGKIAIKTSGSGGFGYDPLFIVEGQEKALAELKVTGGIVETHRTRALKSLFEKLK